MKIAVAGFQHETNRFSPYPTTLFDFEREDGWPGLTSGDAIFDVFPSMNIPLGGFLNFAKGQYEVVPILWASAEPGGLVEDAAFDEISGRILDEIQAALPLDGIYLDLHGAMVTQSHEDGEGELLARLRARFGEGIPIAVSLDLHTNVTMQMTSKADVITIFRTYPHFDMAKTGFRAGELLNQILASGRRPHCVFRKLPLLIPLQSQCTDLEPTRSIYQHLIDAQSLNTVHADVAMGFPPSDIAENGPAIVTYSYSEPVALEKADQIEQEFLQSENRFPYPLYREDEGVRLAKENVGGGCPVLLADIQDNSGAGATSDTTGLLHSLVEHGVKNCAIAAIHDSSAVELAHSTGIGGEFCGSLGGKHKGDVFPPPYRGKFKVTALSDGCFEFHGEMMKGSIANIGPTAALELVNQEAEILVVVSSERIQCLDQALFLHLGINPLEKSILAVKSTVHFRADYGSISDPIILIESPGLNPCQLSSDMLPRLRPGVRIL